MIYAQSWYEKMINAISRSIKARVELYDGAALLDTFTYNGALKEFKIDRLGDNKFFGSGICQKLTVKLRDKERAINITKGQGLEVVFGVENEYLYTCPIFFIEEINRDENTNDLEIVAYDSIYKATSHTVSEVVIFKPYTIRAFAHACGAVLGLPVNIDDNALFDLSYVNGANFNGNESIRAVLDDIAEATGTIYFINRDWELVFKRLDINGEPVLHIDKTKYFTLKSKTAHSLQNVTSATELGDNVTASTGIEGEHMYLRDNAFLDTREDVAILVENILDVVRGLTITQFDLEWRGNWLLEIGDKISLETKDGNVIITYNLSDTITYNGGIVGNTSWSYENKGSETASNPTTIGDALNQTFARVDKVNQKIELKVDSATKNALSSLQLTTEGIESTVVQSQDDISKLTSKVDTKLTASEFTAKFNETLGKGVNSVTVKNRNFTFDYGGLTIASDLEDVSTNVDVDGMKVSTKDEGVVLTAGALYDENGNREFGVKVKNLRSNYIWIGSHSRLEDYGDSDERTGCFWIGG